MKPTDRPFLDAILKLDILFLGYLLERDLEMLSQACISASFLTFFNWLRHDSSCCRDPNITAEYSG
jgi:hypothetical protein